MFDSSKEREKQNFIANGNKLQFPTALIPTEQGRIQGNPGLGNIQQPKDSVLSQPGSLAMNPFDMFNQNGLMKKDKKNENKFQFQNGIQSIDSNSGLGASLNFNSLGDNQAGNMF
jgi:hypothetical protein